MPDEQLDDRVLLAVRAARPASRPSEDSASSDAARLLLERTLTAPRRDERRRRRWTGHAVPAVGVLVTIAVFVLALAVLGHGHHPATNISHSTPGQTPRQGSGPALSLSAGQYAFAVGGDASSRTSQTQKRSGLALIAADQLLAERCMRQRGFRYIPDPAPRANPLPSVTGYPSTFYANPLPSAYPEETLLALRQHQGFAVPGANGHGDPDPDDRYLKTLSPARQRAWRTAWVGRNGCYGAAQVQLFGSRHAANLEQQIPNLIYNHLIAAVYTVKGAIAPSDAGTANAAAAWSRCMRTTTGDVYTDENDLINGLNDDFTGPAARRLAVDDTKCAYSTGQAQVFAAAFRQAATHLPATIQTPLRYLLAHRAAWIKRAQRIVVEQFNSDLTSGAPPLR